MNLTDQQIAQFNSYYNLACKKMQGLLLLDNARLAPISFFEKLRAKKAIRYFEKALEIYPEHWQSLLFIGKLYQRLGLYDISLRFFESALQYEHMNPNIPQEAALVCMHLGKVDKAIELSREAVRRAPKHTAILGNHAMDLLIGGFDEEAIETIDRAISIDASDEINKTIKLKIQRVIAGQVKRPTFKDATR